MAHEPRPSNGAPMERVPTRVPGLDQVLEGGLIRGGVYLLGGRPGTGKTTLGNQLAHEHARAGGNVLCLRRPRTPEARSEQWCPTGVATRPRGFPDRREPTRCR